MPLDLIQTELGRERRELTEKVEALNALGNGDGKQTIVVPAQAIEAFGDAFKLLKGSSA